MHKNTHAHIKTLLSFWYFSCTLACTLANIIDLFLRFILRLFLKILFVQLQDNGCCGLFSYQVLIFSKHFVLLCTFTECHRLFLYRLLCLFRSLILIYVAHRCVFLFLLQIYFFDRWNKRLFMIKDDYDIKCIILNEKQAKQTSKWIHLERFLCHLSRYRWKKKSVFCRLIHFSKFVPEFRNTRTRRKKNDFIGEITKIHEWSVQN